MAEHETDTQARQIMAALRLLLGIPGALAGLETLGECMRDEEIRAYMGNGLLREVMPMLEGPREKAEQAAVAACHLLENAREPLHCAVDHGVEAWRETILPLVEAQETKNQQTPPCLCLSLAALIMLYAGARKNKEGAYTILREAGETPLSESEDTLLAFSRLSCDMDPDMLAYAVLSDQTLWARDLREIPGLEETLAGQLRDLQLIGLRAALQRASGVRVKAPDVTIQ